MKIKPNVIADPWKIIIPTIEHNQISESLCSLGNGIIGQRGNFEEHFSNAHDTLLGNYVAGVYYPDRTRVGWWKNGYPRYYAKVLNATNWIGIDIYVNGNRLDLAKMKIHSFERCLDMQKAYLGRKFEAEFENGNRIKVEARRFLSTVDSEVGHIEYSITPVNFSGTLTISPYLDGDISNQDSNYNEKFWEEVYAEVLEREAYLTTKTKKTEFDVPVFDVTCGMIFDILQDGTKVTQFKELHKIRQTKYVANTVILDVKEGQKITIYKCCAILSDMHHKKEELVENCKKVLKKAYEKGFEKAFQEHQAKWAEKWSKSDIIIEGDVKAQQGIRFNIFQLNQTYTGEDRRLNIGPKGFTGEKYGGSTYWDTEAYCFLYYLCTSDKEVARNLLLYRYYHLPKAMENAEKLGFKDGAALYPMVTMNGEECHNEWEITFEEIHRNGAIAHAIYDYVNYTGEEEYLVKYGIDVLVAISRFWSQRITFSEKRQKYVMLGVTGPNEYENNVNNNWYTNYIACWTMEYTLEVLDIIKNKYKDEYEGVLKRLNLDKTLEKETARWKDIMQRMHLPEDKELGIFLQQDDYLDKEQILVKDLDPSNLPLCQKWSWDRILRSCFIKQADTLQGIYLFEDRFDIETIRRNFEFYEPRTVHESSLSPCVHAIIAAKLGMEEKAYEMYLRTSRLDLDNYNNDTKDGCHITSMAGTWMAMILGFAGMRVKNGKMTFNPMIPKNWKSYQFTVIDQYNREIKKVHVTKDKTTIDVVSKF